MCHPIPRQHPFLRFLQIAAVACKTYKMKHRTFHQNRYESGPIEVGVFRREAAYMGQPRLRQLPFLHSLQLYAVACKNRNLKHKTFHENRYESGPVQVGVFRREAAYMGRSRLRQHPFCALCSFWHEAAKPQNLKHKPGHQGSINPLSSGRYFQKESGFYGPLMLPSTTLMHFTAEQRHKAEILQIWHKTLPY